MIVGRIPHPRVVASLCLLCHVTTRPRANEVSPQLIRPTMHDAGDVDIGSNFAFGGKTKSKTSNKKPGVHLAPWADDPLDSHDPRGPDFEPRAHPQHGGDKWAFGRVHTALHHVLDTAEEGNVSSVIDVLDAFSSEHSLGLSFGRARGQEVERAIRQAVNENNQPTGDANSSEGFSRQALHVLILGADMGSSALWCLPPLLEAEYEEPHEMVSVEENIQRSDVGSQLVRHALGEEAAAHRVRHFPLMPAEDTTLAEVLDTLLGESGYELGPFDAVLLSGRSRDDHQRQLRTLEKKGALRIGAVVHAEGPSSGDAGTQRYLEFLAGDVGGKNRFDVDVRDIWPGVAVIVATHRAGIHAGREDYSSEL